MDILKLKWCAANFPGEMSKFIWHFRCLVRFCVVCAGHRCPCVFFVIIIIYCCRAGSTPRKEAQQVCILFNFQSHEGQPHHSNHTSRLCVAFFYIFLFVVHLLICEHLQTWKENREILNLFRCEPRDGERETGLAFGANSYILLGLRVSVWATACTTIWIINIFLYCEIACQRLIKFWTNERGESSKETGNKKHKMRGIRFAKPPNRQLWRLNAKQLN